MALREKTTPRPVDQAAATALAEPIELGPLSHMTGYALRRAQMAVFEDFFATLAEVDLKPAQFSVLHVLDIAPGSTQSAVAAALGIQRANFVALLDGLEQRGLARRDAAPSDKRSHALHLTPRGAALLARARALEARHEARQVARLGGQDSRDTLLALLARLTTNEGGNKKT